MAVVFVVVFLLASAVVVFYNTCTTIKRMDAERDSVVLYAGELNLIHTNLSDSLKKNSILVDANKSVAVTDSVCRMLNHNQQQILAREESLISDLRDETNYNIDKISAWLSFWVAIIALLGVVVPFLFQYFHYRIEKAEFDQLKNDLKNSQMAYQQSLSKYQQSLSAYGLKMSVQSFSLAFDQKHVNESGSRVVSLYISKVCKDYHTFIESLIDNEPDASCWGEQKPHVYSVLVNIEAFLRKLDMKSNFAGHRQIRNLSDKIAITLRRIEDDATQDAVMEDLRRIETLLMQIH